MLRDRLTRIPQRIMEFYMHTHTHKHAYTLYRYKGMDTFFSSVKTVEFKFYFYNFLYELNFLCLLLGKNTYPLCVQLRIQ